MKIVNNVMTENNIILNKKVANKTAEMLSRDWKSYFKLKGIQQNRRLPGYKKQEFHELIYNNQAFSQSKYHKENRILASGMKTGIQLPYKFKNLDIMEVRITKVYGKIYLFLVYRIDQAIKLNPESNIAAIDLGINCLATLTFNKEKKPIVFKDLELKSINQYYNKQLAYYKSKLPKNKYASRRIEKLSEKRSNRIMHHIHCLTKNIADVLAKEQIGLLIIGYTKNFQQSTNMSKANNQNFVNIPFGKIIKQLEYKCPFTKIVLQEESYTSKANCVNADYIPTYGVDDYLRNFSGYRTDRGLYKIKGTRKFIQADVNGSYNIMRKYLNTQGRQPENKFLRNWLSRGNVVMPLGRRIFS